MDEYEYFNYIARHSRQCAEGISMIKLLSLHKTRNSTLCSNLYCPTDDFYDDYKSPLSLYHTVLKYLHLQLKYKRRTGSNRPFINFVETPNMILSLRLPWFYKNLLGRLYVSCARHSMLITVVEHDEIILTRMRLKEDRELFHFIKNNQTMFPPHMLKKAYQIAQFVEILLSLPQHIFHASSYWELAQLVRANSTKIEIVEKL